MGSSESFKVPERVLQEIIIGADTELLIEWAQIIASKMNEEKLNTTQFRAIFGNLRQIQSMWSENGDSHAPHRKLQLLKPKLAYQAVRNPQVGILRDVLVPSIDIVADDWKRFQNFMDFVEANLAYLIAGEKGRNRR